MLGCCCESKGNEVEFTLEKGHLDKLNHRYARDDRLQDLDEDPFEYEEEAAGSAFEGRWFRQQDGKYVGSIKAGILFFHSDKKLPAHRLTELNANIIQIEYEGTPCVAELRNGRVTWDDGDVWVKQDVGLDGEWYCNGFHKASIRGAWAFWNPIHIAAPELPVIIAPKGDGTFQMAAKGAALLGKLVGRSQLKWSDGQVWEKQSNEVDGDWYIERTLRHVATVRGGAVLVTRSTPETGQIHVLGTHSVVLQMGGKRGKTLEGRIQANKVGWTNGEVWIGGL